jgi:hypothetical protein
MGMGLMAGFPELSDLALCASFDFTFDFDADLSADALLLLLLLKLGSEIRSSVRLQL